MLLAAHSPATRTYVPRAVHAVAVGVHSAIEATTTARLMVLPTRDVRLLLVLRMLLLLLVVARLLVVVRASEPAPTADACHCIACEHLLLDGAWVLKPQTRALLLVLLVVVLLVVVAAVVLLLCAVVCWWLVVFLCHWHVHDNPTNPTNPTN